MLPPANLCPLEQRGGQAQGRKGTEASGVRQEDGQKGDGVNWLNCNKITDYDYQLHAILASMKLVVKINESAFRHGVAAEDIDWVVDHFLYDDALPEYEDKYLAIGFDTRGRLIEILYNVIDETSINVFHAMKCRKGFYDLIGL
jgi:uncharacterized DUF497 family protein